MEHRKKQYKVVVLCIIGIVLAFYGKKNVQAAEAWDGTYDMEWYAEHPDSMYYYINTAEEFAGIPYVISTYHENFYGRTIYLNADIILNSTQNYTVSGDGDVSFHSGANVWKKISQTEEQAFLGCLDGKNHKVLGLYIPSSVTGQYRGLFGRVEKGGMVKNLKIEYFCIESGNAGVNPSYSGYSGAVTGFLKEAGIENCTAGKGRITTQKSAGGIAGCAREDTVIKNCSSSCHLEGKDYIGGIVGYSYADIVQCESRAIIKNKDGGETSGIGGITGYQGAFLSGDLKIYRCNFSGSIGGNGSYAGGIAGQVVDSLKIQCCMVQGSLEGKEFVGGIAGFAILADISQCGVTGDVKGDTKVGGLCGSMTGRSCLRNSYAAGRVIAEKGDGGCLYGAHNHTLPPVITDCVYDKEKMGEGAADSYTLYEQEGITALTTKEIKKGIGAYYIDLQEGKRHLNLWSQTGEYPQPITDSYKRPVYRVSFFTDIMGEEAQILYTDGFGKLTEMIPMPVERKGCYVSWSRKRFDNISEDTEVYPIYRTRYCKVRFLIDGKETESRQVAYGTALSDVPDIPYRPGYTGRWGMHGSLTYITGDVDAPLFYEPVTYIISYHGNGAVGEEDIRQICYYDSTCTVLNNPFEREGYSFAGWNTKSDGSGTGYGEGEEICNLTALPDTEILLYAIWVSDTKNVKKSASLSIETSTVQTNRQPLYPAGKEWVQKAAEKWEEFKNLLKGTDVKDVKRSLFQRLKKKKALRFLSVHKK